jgi:hypothetical protein
MYASYIGRECTKNWERRTTARINRLNDIIDWVSPEEEEEEEEEEDEEDEEEGPNDDWLTFRNHETFIRRDRNVGIPPTKVERGIIRAWNLLIDPIAYAECLKDIDAASHTLRPLIEQEQAAYEADSAEVPRRDRIQMLRNCRRPLHALREALRRFKAVQKQRRLDGVRNVSRTSRRWTGNEIQLATSQARWL